MNEIKKEEMFGNLKSFLKSKGVELQEGSYSEKIRKGCEVLTDSVNLSQRAFEQAKTTMEKGFEQLRQVVHEKTAPKPPASKTGKQSKTKDGAGAKPKTARRKKSVPSTRRRRS